MANNQYVNKVVYGNQTLIDLTSDTITANVMVTGFTAHDKSGAVITGNIPLKSSVDLITQFSEYEYNNPDHYFAVLIPGGYYSQSSRVYDNIQIPVPTTGTNTLTVSLPNNADPDPEDSDDWIPITFQVDSNGNSNITDDTIPASGVSF